MITDEQLKLIYPHSSKANRDKYLPFLNQFMDEYEVNTNLRQRHFLSQIGHESVELLYSKELASGSAYEGRLDLGNTEAGDGVRFKGRGLIQITGRSNYFKLSKAFGVNFIIDPQLLEQPKWAVKSAFWFWRVNNLNDLADLDDIKKVTKKINGGYNGLEDRKRIYKLCKQHLA